MKSVNRVMIESAVKMARDVKAGIVLLCADVKKEFAELPEDVKKSIHFILVTQENENLPEMLAKYVRKLDVPNVNLTRMGKIKIAIAKGIVSGLLKKNDKIICLYADSIFFIDVGKEFEILTYDFISDIVEAVEPEVFNAVLNIACELAAQGRESRKVGTIFVLGDDEKVMQLSRQMIMNPFQGYPEDDRNILNPDLEETIKEYSSIDGAFVIRSNGVIITAGRHLSAALESKDFPSGLGSRHIAAAGITNLTKAVTIVVSQSTGDVTVFKNGRLFVTIEKPVE
jgi:diadenylate cyclase